MKLSKWQGASHALSAQSLKYRIYTAKANYPSFCQSVDQYSFHPRSIQVLKAVKKYENLYLHPITTVAVMIHFCYPKGI